MSEYYYSASNKGFYALSLKPAYEASQSGWPADAIEVSDEIYSALLVGQATGKVITTDSKGKPILADPPPLTTEELQALAAAQKQQLMTQALMAMLPLEKAVKLNVATEEEKAQLDLWEKYSVLLGRVELAKAPKVKWPKPPVHP